MGSLRSKGASSRTENALVDQAVRRFHLLHPVRQKDTTKPSPRIITISRQLGGGGRRIAERLGEELGIPMYDREILELLAKQSGSHYRARMFEALDETMRGEIEDIVAGIGGCVDQNRYFCLLPRVILTFGQLDCIILGRGAHLLLPDALKVRVEASLHTRLRNMQEYEGVSQSAAHDRITESDRSRDRFLKYFIRRIPENKRWFKDRLMYDLILNTDNYAITQAVNIILSAAEQRFGKEFVHSTVQEKTASIA